jgi:octaprenyl-diphosphate synthase
VHEQLQSEVSLVVDVASHIINAGGKRIRPLLVLLIARALGYSGRTHLVLAAIIEFIHTASLLHDDVVDEATLRRGVQSANIRFGNAAAVLVGDFLHTRAFQLMLVVNDIRVMQILAQTTNIIAEGEIMQLMKSRQVNVGYADYYKIIDAKTARLFEAAGALGAHVSGASEDTIVASARFGNSLGMAFQLIDDYLDYAGQTDSLGKSIGNDLREGKMTLPLIFLMQNGSENEKKIIRQHIEESASEHTGAVIDAVKKSHALEYTYQKALHHAKEASRAIKAFPESPYKSALKEMCLLLVKRQK